MRTSSPSTERTTMYIHKRRRPLRARLPFRAGRKSRARRGRAHFHAGIHTQPCSPVCECMPARGCPPACPIVYCARCDGGDGGFPRRTHRARNRARRRVMARGQSVSGMRACSSPLPKLGRINGLSGVDRKEKKITKTNKYAHAVNKDSVYLCSVPSDNGEFSAHPRSRNGKL